VATLLLVNATLTARQRDALAGVCCPMQADPPS